MTQSDDAKRLFDAINRKSTRRDAMAAVGKAVAWGAMASAFGAALPRHLKAEDAARPRCLTIVYPAGEGITFNADYYRDHHLTLIMGLYGDSIERFELRRVAPAPAGMPAAPFAAAINIWIADLAAFDANNQKHGPQLIADVPNFTNAQPTIQNDAVHGMAGKPASAIAVGDTCLTILYPNQEGVRWDVDYYNAHHMPLIMDLYGEKAIKRFELRKGHSDQAGAKPPYIGSINIYIADQAAFDAAGQAHTQALVDDVPNFSSVMPMAFPTIVHGVG